MSRDEYIKAGMDALAEFVLSGPSALFDQAAAVVDALAKLGALDGEPPALPDEEHCPTCGAVRDDRCRTCDASYLECTASILAKGPACCSDCTLNLTHGAPR